jgi:hypothetical protein
MEMATKIWTGTAYDMLFETLVERFGPYSAWECETAPKTDNIDYYKFLEAFAETIGASNRKAVGLVVNHAIGKAVHHEVFVFASAAAMHCGFITKDEFMMTALSACRAPVR